MYTYIMFRFSHERKLFRSLLLLFFIIVVMLRTLSYKHTSAGHLHIFFFINDLQLIPLNESFWRRACCTDTYTFMGDCCVHAASPTHVDDWAPHATVNLYLSAVVACVAGPEMRKPTRQL